MAAGSPNLIAISFFLGFIALSLGITWAASRRTRSTDHFYTAGRSVTAFQNGLALAGDYMSAASFLGIAGLVATSGFDGLIYSIGFLVGWPIVTFLIAEPLRNLGRYTFADVVALRLRQVPVRIAAALGSLAVIAFYLIAQMVGAGNLIRLLFGLPYEAAVVIVGVVMLVYVLFGGMIATTWVQIVKAVLLLGGATLLALLVLARFGFSPLALFDAAAQRYGEGVLAPGRLVSDPIEAVSLGLALMLGTAGLPHILMRFYTVADARTARSSVGYATAVIGFFYLLTFVLGFGATVIVGREAITKIDAGGNMNAGDEMRLRFTAAPPPPPGWHRDFVLIGDGWEKDGDYNTDYSATVMPLPSHARSTYRAASASFELEDDPVYREHRTDWDTYHTRYVTPEPFLAGLR